MAPYPSSDRAPCTPAAVLRNRQYPLSSSLPVLPNEPASLHCDTPVMGATHHIYMILTRSRPCNCTQISGSWCLFPVLRARVCRHFRETRQLLELLERVWGISPCWCLADTSLLTCKRWRWPCLSLILLLFVIPSSSPHALCPVILSHFLTDLLVALSLPQNVVAVTDLQIGMAGGILCNRSFQFQVWTCMAQTGLFQWR